MQTISDSGVNMLLGFLILLHAGILVMGFSTKKLAWWVAVINNAMAAFLLVYILILEMLVSQHAPESFEVILLLAEMAILGSGIAYLVKPAQNEALKPILYIFFGIHLLILIAGLIFMLTFKLDRLF